MRAISIVYIIKGVTHTRTLRSAYLFFKIKYHIVILAHPNVLAEGLEVILIKMKAI